MPFHKIFVPTADVVCYSYIIGGLLRNGVNALVIGNRGCGKTSCIRRTVLHDLADNVYSTMTVTFSAHMTSAETQEVKHMPSDQFSSLAFKKSVKPHWSVLFHVTRHLKASLKNGSRASGAPLAEKPLSALSTILACRSQMSLGLSLLWNF